MIKCALILLLAASLSACAVGKRDGRSHAFSTTADGQEVNIWMSYFSNYSVGEFQAITRDGINCVGDVKLQPNQKIRFPISCNDGQKGWAEVSFDPQTRIAHVEFSTNLGWTDKKTLEDYPYAFP